MAAYYYFASTLPMLSLTDAPPYTVDAFMVRAREMVSKRDYTLLEAALKGEETRNTFLGKWQHFQEMLKSELARQRSKHVDFTYDLEPLEDEVEFAICEAVHAAIRADNPLEAEQLLLQLQWNAIDEFVGLATFSIEAICAHLLRLILVERRAHFDAEMGNMEFTRLFTDLQTEIAQR